MFALRQGRKSWIRLIWGETLLNICNEKTKILERTWSEDGAALVRTWYGEGVIRFFTFLLTLHTCRLTLHER